MQSFQYKSTSTDNIKNSVSPSQKPVQVLNGCKCPVVFHIGQRRWTFLLLQSSVLFLDPGLSEAWIENDER